MTSQANSEWKNVSIFDIARPKQWKTIPKKELLDEGFPVYGANGQIGYFSDFTHETPTLMITCRGASCGNVHISEPKSYINGNAMALDNLSENVNIKYLYYYLQSANFTEVISGSAQPQITQEGLKKLVIKLAPAVEQKRIADKLDSVLTKVEAAQARLDKIPTILKRFRQSVLAAATSGELTKDWREENEHARWDIEKLAGVIYKRWQIEREKEFLRKGKKPKTNTWLKKFPNIQACHIVDDHWIELSLENIAEVVDPNPSHRMPKYVVAGLPFVSSENILSVEKLNFEKGKKITEEEVVKQKTRYEICNGTFAYTRIGTIGKSVLLPSPHNYGISHAMAVVNPYDEVVDSKYLIWVMNCESILKQAQHGVQSVGVPDLGIGKLKAFRMPLPPLGEQKEIVKRINELFEHANTVEKQYNAAKARLDKLTQSILAKAFRGELTAVWRAQHPDLISGDNSAEALLAKIKAEREAMKPSKKTRKKKNDK